MKTDLLILTHWVWHLRDNHAFGVVHIASNCYQEFNILHHTARYKILRWFRSIRCAIRLMSSNVAYRRKSLSHIWRRSMVTSRF